MKTRHLVVVLGLLIVGCGTRDSRTDLGHYFYEEEDADGITVAVTSAVPKYDQPLFTYTEVARLQQDDNVPESLLYRTYDFVRAEDGTYIAMDGGNDRLAIFDSDGAYLRQIGRSGDGPGEFRSPRLLWVRGDRIAVYDSRHRRTCIFLTDGTLLETHSAPTSGGSVSELHPIPDGRRVLRRYQSERYPDGSRDTRYDLVVESAAGDTLAIVKGRPRHLEPPVDTGGGLLMAMQDVFAPTGSLQYQPEIGILSFWTGESHFDLFNLAGELVRRIRIDLEQKAVTQEDRDSVIRFYEGWVEEAEDDQQRALYQALIDHAVFGETKPYYQGVSVDEYGYFWITDLPDYGLSTSPTDAIRMRLLSPEGEYLGDTEFPIFPMRLDNGQHLCTWYEDEETGETDYIVYRMEPAVPGFVYP